jgi:hypothetical protein
LHGNEGKERIVTLLAVGHLSGNLKVDLARLGKLRQPGDLVLNLSISAGTKTCYKKHLKESKLIRPGGALSSEIQLIGAALQRTSLVPVTR